MKVLLLDQYRDVGGGQTVFLQILRCLVARNVAVTAAIPLGGSLEAAVRAEWNGRVECVGIPEPTLTSGHKTVRDAARLLGHGAELFRLRRRLPEFDLVYVNGARLFPAFIAMSSTTRTRVIYHVHLDHGAVERAIIGAALAHPRTHAVLACSDFVARGLRSTLGPLGHTKKLKLVENALGAPFSSLAFVDRWRSDSPRPAVVIGKLIPEKGPDIVLELARAHPRMTFHMIGDADPTRSAYADALRARAPENVVFHGRVANVRDHIEAIGACVNLVPSQRAESFGLAALEGMACSCLTVTSDAGGLEDIAKRTGAWTARSMRDWHAAIDRILSSPPEEMAAIARAQHEKTLSLYAPDRFARDLMSVIESLTAASEQ